ncbi:hypothetical protein [Saccharothrix variisporea]|uniref:Uncharacterized protein n=1 Tax=Saccharothrix variisporea TaxID=543527 RepID=A0A495X8V9_9PSEU|nr:hypothetical protein [Saccharothrix variisporea]RKT69595.1 hypothetical protein DFJ66_2829 [Saccharothrix variisporea]
MTTRADIRAFIRQHHPDVGGDPEHFVRGLAELRAARRDGTGSRFDAPVVVVRRTWWNRLFTRRPRRVVE